MLPASGAPALCSNPATGWGRAVAPSYFTVPTTPSPASTVTDQYSNQTTAWTVLGGDKPVLLASDGSEIVRSVDGGCSWTVAFTVSGALTSAAYDLPDPVNTQPYYVVSLIAVPGVGNESRAYAVLGPGGGLGLSTFAGSAPPALIVASTDAGASWSITTLDVTAAASTLPHCVAFHWAGVAPTKPDVLYLYCQTGLADQLSNEAVHNSSSGAVLYRTTDRGATWSQQLFPSDYVITSSPAIAVDPRVPSRVWVVGNRAKGIEEEAVADYSDDGGPWKTAGVVLPRVRMNLAPSFGIDAWASGKSARLLVWSTTEGIRESRDNGQSWRTVAAPADGAGVAQRRVPLYAKVLYFENGDIAAVQRAGQDCATWRTTLQRFSGDTGHASLLPSMPSGWGARLGGFEAAQTAGRRHPALFGMATVNGSSGCGTAFLASYRGSR